MSLDEHVRAVSRALRHGLLSDTDKEMLAQAVFGMPEMLGRLEAVAQSRWPELSKEQWNTFRDSFYIEVNRRYSLEQDEMREARARAAAERLAAQEQRQRDFEAQAIVVPLAPASASPKQQAWSQFDKLFGQVGEQHHATMPAGYGPREVNSLRAYLKRHFPRLAVSTRANSLGNETYVYRRPS